MLESLHDEPLFDNYIETYLTISDIMNSLKVSRSTVFRFIKKYKIQSTQIGRLKRFKARDINKALS